MKILMVCQYYYPEPFRITDICETLAQKGHQVTVLTGLPNYPEGKILDSYKNKKKRKEFINGVHVIRTSEIGRGSGSIKLFLNYLSFSLSASIKAFRMKENFDVVFVNQLSPVLMALPAIMYKKRNNKKMLLYCLDLWPESLVIGGIKADGFIYNAFLKVSRWIYKQSDKILVSSSMFEDYFQETLNLKGKEIVHLPQYAEEIFLEKNSSPNDQTQFPDEKKEFNFVFAGNIGDAQNVETIVRAANELKAQENIKFHIVGDGSNLSYCKSIASDLKVDNLFFYGRRSLKEMPSFYQKADAMLVTLKDEKNISYTLPGKVQSYMAAGKPIIGAINGETQRLINISKCGLCCAAEDYKGLSSLILQFCTSEARYQMAENSLRFYLDNFGKEGFIESLEKQLKALEAK